MRRMNRVQEGRITCFAPHTTNASTLQAAAGLLEEVAVGLVVRVEFGRIAVVGPGILEVALLEGDAAQPGPGLRVDPVVGGGAGEALACLLHLPLLVVAYSLAEGVHGVGAPAGLVAGHLQEVLRSVVARVSLDHRLPAGGCLV